MGVLACTWLPATNNTTDNLQNVLALTYMANSGGHQSIGFVSPEQSLYVRCPVNPWQQWQSTEGKGGYGNKAVKWKHQLS